MSTPYDHTRLASFNPHHRTLCCRILFLILVLFSLALKLPIAAHAQYFASPEIAIPLRVVFPYECYGNANSGCRSIDQLQDAVRRGNTFWKEAGLRFWIKSVEYHNLPLMKQNSQSSFSWSQVVSEIQTVFPNVPANAYQASETKQGRHWLGAAAVFYGDPSEVLVFVNDRASSASGPWGGRMVWLHPGNIWKPGLFAAPTTLPHELGHFLGLQHPGDSYPSQTYYNPSTDVPYTQCEFWDQNVNPSSPPQFFSTNSSPGCNASGVVRIGRVADVVVDAPMGNVTIGVSGSTFGPNDWQTQIIAAPTGLPHLPPEQWGYSLNLMGGFAYAANSAKPDGRVPRHLAPTQIEIVYDFLLNEHPIIPSQQAYYLRADNTVPPGALPASLSSQRTALGKAKDDFLWWSNGTRNGEFSFAKEVKNLGPGYRPVSGDFDGDGYDDIFWYRPSTGAATAWWGNSAGSFDTVHGYQYSAYARLFAGDFDGNGMDDLYFFYRSGSGIDVVAYGIGNRQFSNQTEQSTGNWEPFAADLDGDLDDDIVWFDPLADNAEIWWSGAENLPGTQIGTDFTVQSGISIGGQGASHCRRPVVGNFDGSYGDDVFWYCAGTGSEKIWLSNGTQSPLKMSAFGSMPASVDGFYRPFAGDFDGDGFDDIFWDDSSPAADAIWAGHANSPQAPQVHRTDIHGFFEAIAGDFDGDGDTDVFWYRDSADRWVEAFGSSAAVGSWQVDSHPRLMADVNNDGREDIVGFGNSGVHVSMSTGDSFTPAIQWTSNFGSNGWDSTRHPRLVGDVDDDGKEDIVGFGNSSVYVGRSTGLGFAPQSAWVSGFGYSQGWRVDKHPRMLADIDDNGKMDIVGFGNSGVYVSLSWGTSFTNPGKWVTGFGYSQGWRTDRHPRFIADVNGDQRPDVVGFGNSDVWVALSMGLGFAAPQPWVHDFGYSQGWSVSQNPRFVTDVDGDGRADIVGLSPSRDLLVSLSTGNGFSAPTVWASLDGLLDYAALPDTLTVADVSGDGRSDVVAFGGYEDTYFAISTGTSFTRPRPWIDDYGTHAGWNTTSHLRTVADVNGDGRGDLVGFGGSGVWVWPADFCFAGDEL